MIWFNAFEQVIEEKQILPENTYNFDESEFSIDKIEVRRVIINSRIRQKYKHNKVDKSEFQWFNVLQRTKHQYHLWWNSKARIYHNKEFPLIYRRIENFHAIHEVEQVIFMIWNDLYVILIQSQKKKRARKHALLFVMIMKVSSLMILLNICRNNNIELLLLISHSSHMTQSLNVAIFGSLKMIMTTELIHELIQIEITKIQKPKCWFNSILFKQSYSSYC